jgi:parallel beta-helix repeat protein
MIAGKRILSFGIFVAVIIGLPFCWGLPLCWAADMSQSTTPVVKAGVARAFATQERIKVLIRLKEASSQPPGYVHTKTEINDLQARFRKSFPSQGLINEITISRNMQRIPWIAAIISRNALGKLRNHQNVSIIEQDIPIYARLSESSPQIGGNRSYHTGYAGGGISVAVLDTGIDTDHPDLVDSVVWEECFLSGGACPTTGTDRASGPGSAEDGEGHGSHVSGIITSDNDIYRGIAPDAGIVAIKILDNSGTGELSDLVAALDWVAENHATQAIRIVNMSLGSSVYEGTCDNQYDSLTEAANAVHAEGIALFAASGNDASDYRIDMPACLSNVISVGAVYDADVGERTYQDCTDTTTAPDQIACFSNVSNVLDLLAPGARITSMNRYGGTTIESGTSMACPHAAAMAALLLQVNPDLSPEDLRILMAESGAPIYDDRIEMEFPRIDIATALGITISADPLVHDFDYIAPGDHSASKLFTITNGGPAGMLVGTLALSPDHPSDFQIVADSCSQTVLAGESTCTVSVQFTPTATGTRRSTLLVPTDDPVAPELFIELKGRSGQAYFVNDPATANDIWCTAAGDDANDGRSPGSPKASVQSVLADYDLEPGDVVRIDTGLYILSSNIGVTTEDSGDNDQPVMFTASPYGVMFDRGDQTVGSYPWYFYQCDYVTLTTVDDDTYPSIPKSWPEVVGGFMGIYLYESDHIEINRFSAHRNGYRGIYANKSHGAKITNNLIFDNNAYGLVLGAANNVTIENNTVIGGTVYAVHLDGSSNHAILKNNIILADGSGAYCIYKSDYASIDAADYNLLLAASGARIGYYETYAGDLAEWQTVSGLDANSISTDPLFRDQLTSDYHLSSASPAIDSGDPASDCALEPQPNGSRINMGAYGGTSEAAVNLVLDVNGDGDVDGLDLYDYAAGGSFDAISAFAQVFGQ